MVLPLAVAACSGRGQVPTTNAARATSSPFSRHATVHRDGPAVVTRAQVAAPLFVRMREVARYCYEDLVRVEGNPVVRCHPGQRGSVARLLELGFTARRATGPHSWYAWNLEAPPGCWQASADGPTWAAVRAGRRLVFDVLIPPDCRGTGHVEAAYWTEALTADVERSTLVGRRTLTLH